MEYVLVYVQEQSDNVLLVRKKSPEWQAGKLNLPGGKIEEGESPTQAAEREFVEETGYLLVSSLTLLGKIIGPGYIVHCFSGEAIDGMTTHDEDTGWYDFHQIQEELIPNLRVIIPLAKSQISGWEIYDYGETHEFRIKLC